MKRWIKAYQDYELPQSIASPKPNFHPTPFERSRRELIFDLRLYGLTFAEIGRYVGISAKRASDIFKLQSRRRSRDA